MFLLTVVTSGQMADTFCRAVRLAIVLDRLGIILAFSKIDAWLSLCVLQLNKEALYSCFAGMNFKQYSDHQQLKQQLQRVSDMHLPLPQTHIKDKFCIAFSLLSSFNLKKV